jgi:hypothetical protein
LPLLQVTLTCAFLETRMLDRIEMMRSCGRRWPGTRPRCPRSTSDSSTLSASLQPHPMTLPEMQTPGLAADGKSPLLLELKTTQHSTDPPASVRVTQFATPPKPSSTPSPVTLCPSLSSSGPT